MRHSSVDRTTINLRDGRGQVIHGKDSGTAIRVIVNGSWGFVSIASTEQDSLIQGVKDACSLARLAGKRNPEPVELADTEPNEDIYRLPFQVDPRTVPPADKFDLLVNVHENLVGYDERIRGSTISYADITGIQHYRNSDDVIITMDKCVSWARILANGRENAIRAAGREEIGSRLGYYIFDESNIHEVTERLAKRIITNLEAKTGKGGVFPAVLGPPVAGVLAHEACGHLFEADLTLNGVIGNVLGQKIGSEFATIVDDGTHPDGIYSYPYDDEGTPSKCTVLMDRGRINALLTDREYSKKFEKILGKQGITMDCSPSGSARAFDHRVRPVIRMRNTYFESGDLTWEELLEPIKFGYWFPDFRGGQAQLNGTFTVGVQEAYEIVNGELGDPVRGISISGHTLETLKEISGLGKPGSFGMDIGRCGKFQVAFISGGSPNLRVDKITVPGQ